MSEFTHQSPKLDPSGNRNAGLQVSQLRFYSVGVVASNKEINSKFIEVTPLEELPLLDGEITSAAQVFNAKGTDAKGNPIDASLVMTNTLRAEWLPFCDAQRLTAPDVRRGETVIIYQFSNADRYYWTTLKNDNRLRKLETVIWAFSATQDENKGLDATTSYFFEVSTHKKLITLHTSQDNGEAFGYDIQINAAESRIVVTDTAGNEFLLDSSREHLRLKNASGNYTEVIGNVANIFTKEQINAVTKSYNVEAQTISMRSSANTTIQAGADLSATAGSKAQVQGASTRLGGSSEMVFDSPIIKTP